MAQEFDVIVIGGGPGGYVAAIKASQLGMSTAIVEKDKLGGVCLNWGCIPSKALLKSAEVMNLVKRSDDFGIKIENFSVDITKIVSRSRQAAVKMSKGVEYLIRHNKIQLFEGTGKLKSNSAVEISCRGKRERQYQENTSSLRPEDVRSHCPVWNLTGKRSFRAKRQ